MLIQSMFRPFYNICYHLKITFAMDIKIVIIPKKENDGSRPIKWPAALPIPAVGTRIRILSPMVDTNISGRVFDVVFNIMSETAHEIRIIVQKDKS